MARLARVILPGYPHHIIQRGNRRQDVFFADSNYKYYLTLLREWCREETHWCPINFTVEPADFHGATIAPPVRT